MIPKTYKRLLAYIIDTLLLGVIFIIFYKLIPINNEVIPLNHSLKELEEKFLNGTILFREYFSNYIQISYNIDKLNMIQIAINLLLVSFYFIIIPILTKGYTLGLYLFSLKIDGKLKFKNLFMRSIIINGLLFMISSVIAISFLNYKYYFVTITILGFIQFLLVIISIFMIIYRKDKRGLQDIISNTKIIPTDCLGQTEIISTDCLDQTKMKSVSGLELLEIIRIGQIQPDIGIDFVYKGSSYLVDYDCIDPSIEEDLLSNILIILKNDKLEKLFETTSFQEFFEKAMIDFKFIKDINNEILCDIDKYNNYFKMEKRNIK